MEVHHHAHTSKKKWTHYFWEFLMLFLAVTLGFVVENWREHFIENQRAKELARSFYYELYSDSINVKKTIDFRLTKENSLDYLKHYLADSNLEQISREFFPAVYFGVYRFIGSQFVPKEVILEQLKNSGALRYFKDEFLQKNIGELSLAISNVKARNERERVFFNDYLVPFLMRHYDQDWLDRQTNDGAFALDEVDERLNREIPGRISNLELLNKDESKNMIGYYQQIVRITRQGSYDIYYSLNHQLLGFLRKKYKLE